MIEFSLVGLSVVLVSLFTLQLGLIYHANTTLNYAVFEAARSGAVNNGSMTAIRTELGVRLAPLEGGDGSRKKALLAIAKSSLKTKDPFNTKVVVLNPTKAAFRDWAIRDPDTGERFIPINHLRHQSYAVGKHSGLSLRDANILKLQVTHGFDLHVPVVGKLMAEAMRWVDAGNAVFYLRGKWPLQSVATVRMQSNSLESEILSSAVDGGVIDGGGSSSTSGGSDSIGGGSSVADNGANAGLGGADSDTSGGFSERPEMGDLESEGNAESEGNLPGNTVAQDDGNGETPVAQVPVEIAPESIDCRDHYARVLAPDQRVRALQGTAELMSTGEFRQLLAQGTKVRVATQIR